MPGVMIRKCAIVTALREAFPSDFQGMYDSAEIKNVPDKLPQKEVVIGKATIEQKRQIMDIAEDKGLYNRKNKDTTELEKFCSSNGYDLKELKFEEVDALIILLKTYKPTIDDADFKEVEEDQQIEGQQSFV